ncbi:MAG: glycosyltransferase family 2 protein [Desulfobacterales bacterium]|nr:glycosyltransferase family 2 protein [Desulfobacterales bacterium]
MPAVSVIIPTYNRARFLKEAICSVLAQDFHDFELIVVDDGSTDDSPQLLGSYPKIRIVRQDRRGVSAARNAGIARAPGRFVAFLDSDDLWLPGKLSAQVAFFETHPTALICQTEEVWIRNGIRVNPKKQHKKHSGMIFGPSLELCLVSPSAVMMQRRLLDEVGGFDETLPACEDYDLWLRIACRFPIYLISTPLVVKRGGHKDQLSSEPGVDRFRIRALEKILESNLLTPKQRAAALEALKKKCAIYAGGCFKRRRINEANEYLRLPAKFTQGGQGASGYEVCLPAVE